MSSKKINVGDIVRPVDYTPVWECRTTDPGKDAIHGVSSVGVMGHDDVALVVGQYDDPEMDWRELQVLFKDTVGWVLEPHMKRVKR